MVTAFLAMNYKRHYFWMNMAGAIGASLGGLVWFIDASVRMFSHSVAKMPFDAIAWRMYAYPAIGGALVWLLVRFPWMARCDACGARLRYRRQAEHIYVCPQCGATFDPDARQTAAGQPQDASPGVGDVLVEEAPGAHAWLARLRQKLYPRSQAGQTTWKIALGALCVMALLSTCVPIKGLEVDVMGIAVPKSTAACVAWMAWALLNLYLLAGTVWNLIDPEDEKTGNLAWWRRLLLIGFGVVSVSVSLLAPLFLQL